MTLYNPDTYCPIAFAGFDTREKKVCCVLDSTDRFDTFSKMSKSNLMQELKKDLLSGIKNKLCNHCWVHEAAGAESLRQTFSKKITDEIIQQEIQEKKLKYLVIDSGNVCNLACRTCGPWSSSSHIKEYEEKNIKFGRSSWPMAITKTDLEYLQSEDLSMVTTVSVLGGEPFQNLEHLSVLDAIINQGYAANCSLNYTTNCTITLPNKIKDKFNKFKSVHFMLSVDAVNEQAEYIRTNSKWQVVSATVEYFKELSKNNPAIRITMHPTISVLNVMYLDEMYQWFAENNLKSHLIFCEQPEWYSFNIFDDYQKEILIRTLESSEFDMLSVIQRVDASTFNQNALDNFYREVEFTTEFRKLDIYRYLPRLMTLLGRQL